MRRLLGTLLVIGLLTTQALGQGFGLQVADTAAAANSGMIQASAGLAVGEDAKFIGARAAFAPLSGLKVFVDGGMILLGEVGSISVDDSNTGFGVAGGVLYTVPVQLPVDLAVRGTVYKPFFKDMNSEESIAGVGSMEISVSIIGMNIAAVASMADVVAGLSPYVAAGLNYVRTTVEGSLELDIGHGMGAHSQSWDDTMSDTDPFISAGVIWALNNLLSFYAEVSHMGDLFAGAGARATF